MNNSIRYLTITLFLLVSLSVWAHKYYISICQIDYNEKEKNLEISLKLFYDDIAAAIKNRYSYKINTQSTMPAIQGDSRQACESNDDSYLFSYIEENFYVMANGKKLKLQWVGKELEQEEVLWCYIEVPKVNKFNKLAVQNTLLFDIFSDQVNLIHINANSERHTLTLDKGHQSSEFVWK